MEPSSSIVIDLWAAFKKVCSRVNNAGYFGLIILLGLLSPWINPRGKNVLSPTVSLIVMGGLFAFAIGYCVVVALVPHIQKLLASQPHVGASSLPQNQEIDVNLTSETDQWWLLHAGRPTGPHAFSSLRDAAQRGDFALDALVCRVGSQAWTALRNILSLPLTNSTPPPIPASFDNDAVVLPSASSPAQLDA